MLRAEVAILWPQVRSRPQMDFCLGHPLGVIVCLFKFKHRRDFTKIEIWGFLEMTDLVTLRPHCSVATVGWICESATTCRRGLCCPDPSVSTHRGSVPVNPASVINLCFLAASAEGYARTHTMSVTQLLCSRQESDSALSDLKP